jgi:hypothetical protein
MIINVQKDTWRKLQFLVLRLWGLRQFLSPLHQFSRALCHRTELVLHLEAVCTVKMSLSQLMYTYVE